ncbi:MAG: hypothetical protein ACE5JG_13275, partial [Planctomycetota bacterium]
VLMSLITTKLPHYILPIWPALAVAAAAVLERAARGALSLREQRSLQAGVWWFAPVVAVAAGALGAAPWLVPLPAARLPGLLAAALLLGGSAVAVGHHLRGRIGRGAAWLAGTAALHQLLLAALVLPAVERHKPIPPLARELAREVPADIPVVVSGFKEPSLQLYLGRWPLEEVPPGPALARWARADAPGVVVIERRRLERVEAEHGALGLTLLVHREGINVAKGRWVELLALGRNWPPED